MSHPIAEVYLAEWGACLRRGWSPYLDIPPVNPVFAQAVPKRGEWQEPEYIQYVNTAVNELSPMEKEAIHITYVDNIRSMTKAAKELKTNRRTFKVMLHAGETGVYMYLKAIGFIRAV